MKVSVPLGNDVYVEFEADTTKEIVDELTKIEELRTEPCGKCKQHNTFVRAKVVGDNVFYGMECRDCHAVLNYGVSKDKKPHVYKKRVEVDEQGKAVKDKDNKVTFLGVNGWVIYNKQTGKLE